MEILTKPSLSAMAEGWSSSHVTRQELERFTGGILTSKYSAWLDSQGKGIKDRLRIGRKIVYPVKSVLEFLESRASFVEQQQKDIDINLPRQSKSTCKENCMCRLTQIKTRSNL